MRLLVSTVSQKWEVRLFQRCAELSSAVHSSFAVCTSLLITLLLPPQKNMWLVTPAAPQRPSCRRTLASISCSVKRATPAALSPVSRLVSRLWRAREHSFAPKPTKALGNWGAPLLSAHQSPEGRSMRWTPPWFTEKTPWIGLWEGLAVVFIIFWPNQAGSGGDADRQGSNAGSRWSVPHAVGHSGSLEHEPSHLLVIISHLLWFLSPARKQRCTWQEFPIGYALLNQPNCSQAE